MSSKKIENKIEGIFLNGNKSSSESNSNNIEGIFLNTKTNTNSELKLYERTKVSYSSKTRVCNESADIIPIKVEEVEEKE